MANRRKNQGPKSGYKGGTNRSWKALSQDVGEAPVTPFAWRKRLIPIFKGLLACAVFSAVCYGIYSLSGKVDSMQRSVLSGVGNHPEIQEIRFQTDGVLTESFVKEHLNLYEGAALVNVDIFDIKQRLEEFEQIRSATVERSIANAFINIRVLERHPIFKMVVQGPTGSELRLVDSDGASFKAHGFSRNTLLRLPAIGGVALRSNGGRYQPIEEIISLNHLQATIREMTPRWFSAVSSIVLRQKSSQSGLLGHYFVMRTDWCDELILDPESLEAQLIRLDRLMEELIAGGVDLGKRRLQVVDLTVDDRAIVRFDLARTPHRKREHLL
ncbi:MAG: FtsQ-type POTRA domain-containing protein [Verrucomicrobiota bacterium]